MKAIITVTNQVRYHGAHEVKVSSNNIGSVRALNRLTDGKAVSKTDDGSEDKKSKTPASTKPEVHSYTSGEVEVEEAGAFLNRFERGTPSASAEVRRRQMEYSFYKAEVLTEAGLPSKTNLSKLKVVELAPLARKLAKVSFTYYVCQVIIEITDDEGNVSTIRSKKRMSPNAYPCPNGWKVRKSAKKSKKTSNAESKSSD